MHLKGDLRFCLTDVYVENGMIVPNVQIDLVLANNSDEYNAIAPMHSAFLKQHQYQQADHVEIAKLYNISITEYEKWMNDSIAQYAGLLIEMFHFPEKNARQGAYSVTNCIGLQLLFRNKWMGFSTLPEPMVVLNNLEHQLKCHGVDGEKELGATHITTLESYNKLNKSN